MNNVFIFAILLFGMLPAVRADLRLLKGRYALAHFEIGKQERKAGDALDAKYRQALVNLRGHLKQRGDLDAVIVVDEELKRFAELKDVGPEVPPSVVKIMNGVFKSYREERKGIRVKAAIKKLELANNYFKTLSEEETRLVKANEIVDAKKVRVEIEALIANAELAKAKKVVAAASERKAQDAVAPVSSSPVGSVVRIPELPTFLNKGLVLHLPFNESDPRRMKDVSGTGAKVSVRGAKVESEGRVGRALALGGGGDRAEVAHSAPLYLPGAVTVAMWVKLEKWDSGGGLCSKGEGKGNVSLLMDIAGGQYRFVRWNAAKTRFLTAVSRVRPRVGVWQHVAAVSDGKRMKIYVDGQPDSGVPIDEEILVNTDPFIFGSRKGTGGANWSLTGALDEVMVYDRALSEHEIKSLIKYGAK